MSTPTVRAAALSSDFAPCAQADMSRLLKLLVILVKRADSRCSTSCGCRSGSTDAHHRSSELVAARITSKKSGSQEGKSCWGAKAAGSRPALSKPSQAACSVSQFVNIDVEARLCTVFQVASSAEAAGTVLQQLISICCSLGLSVRQWERRARGERGGVRGLS